MEKNDKNNFMFVVTGFGPFQGVADNPTSILARELPAYLQQHCANDTIATLLAPCTHTVVIETSASAVRQAIQALQDKLSSYQTAIVLHLGVSGASRFRLESCAYNDATFRVPDEQGYQPRGDRVVDSCAWGSTLTTSLNVASLVDIMNQTVAIELPVEAQQEEEELPNQDNPNRAETDDKQEADEKDNQQELALANPSTDPGRFVCNYVYCTSLDAFACAQSVNGKTNSSSAESPPPRVQTLFLHVPSFDHIAKEDQLVFVTQLMKVLYQEKMKGATLHGAAAASTSTHQAAVAG